MTNTMGFEEIHKPSTVECTEEQERVLKPWNVLQSTPIAVDFFLVSVDFAFFFLFVLLLFDALVYFVALCFNSFG